MDFLWSSLLALLVLLPAMVAVYVWSMRRQRRSGVRYSSLALVREAAPGSARLRRHLPFALFVAALGAIVVAMARPVVILAVPTNQTTIILTIDVSGSMCSSDIPPSRLEAAEAAAASFIKSQASSTRIGIVAFSSFAEVVQAPTNDQAALLSALHSLATGRRTAIGDGILASIDAISQVDPSVAKSQTDSSTGTAPDTGAQGRLRARHRRPAHRRREQHRHGAARRRPAGRRPGRPRLHDRLRHRERRSHEPDLRAPVRGSRTGRR